MAMQQPARVGAIVFISAAILTDDERNTFIDYFQPLPLDQEGTRFKTMWNRIFEFRGPGATLEMLSTSFMMNLLGGETYEWEYQAAFV